MFAWMVGRLAGSSVGWSPDWVICHGTPFVRLFVCITFGELAAVAALSKFVHPRDNIVRCLSK